MTCGQCNSELDGCTCPDLNDRMRELSGPDGFLACRWCSRCDQHYARCQCGEPVWRLRINGALEDHPSMAPFNAATPEPAPSSTESENDGE